MIEDLQNIITFLEENEQYGDDWQKEIQTLKDAPVEDAIIELT